MRVKRKDMNNAVYGGKDADDTALKKQFQNLEKARQNSANERLQFVIGVRNVLGPERFQQLKSNFKKWP